MRRAEQRKMLDDLIELLRVQLQRQSSRWPEHWTGVELSWLIEEGASCAACSHARHAMRHGEFINDVNVQNL